MRHALFAITLAVCSLAAAPSPPSAPSTQPAPLEPPAVRKYVQPFARPTTRPQARIPARIHPIDPLMPNALPPQYDLRRLPRYPVPLAPQSPPSTQPSRPTPAPYLMLPDGAHVMPPGWKAFRFNGEDVYVIPLGHEVSGLLKSHE